jgi:hypothetical protein
MRDVPAEAEKLRIECVMVDVEAIRYPDVSCKHNMILTEHEVSKRRFCICYYLQIACTCSTLNPLSYHIERPYQEPSSVISQISQPTGSMKPMGLIRSSPALNHRKQLNFPRVNLNGFLLTPWRSALTPPPTCCRLLKDTQAI